MADFILLMVHCCSYSMIEMMQADAKIAKNTIQNDMRMPRRSSFHHGSSKYKHNSSSVRPSKLYKREKERKNRTNKISKFIFNLKLVAYVFCQMFCDKMRKQCHCLYSICHRIINCSHDLK